MPVAEREVQTAAGRLHAEVEGDLSRGAVLIASGGPGAGHDHYHPWFSRLAGERAVVYLDYLGCGRSAPSTSGSYSVELFAANIEAVRRDLDLDRLSIIGLSFGAYPAIEYTLTHPGRVEHLVLSNGHASAETWQQWNIDGVNAELARLFPSEWCELLSLRERGTTSLDAEYQRLFTKVLPDLEWVEPWTHPKLEGSGEFSLDVYRSVIGDDPEWRIEGTLAGYDARPRLHELEAPTLVVSGRYDRLTPPVVAHELFAGLGPDRRALHVFERSAHRPWVEEADAYFELLLRHLR